MGNVVDKNKKLLSLAGYPVEQNYEHLTVLSVRELPPPQRLQMVRDAIVKFRPDFVLIDGIRDLGNDFNNVEETTKIINEILALSSQYNCAIMNVIHQNKGKDDTPRGHLGTELMNKCSDGYYVSRPVGSPVMVSQKISRNAPINDWHFYINEEHL